MDLQHILLARASRNIGYKGTGRGNFRRFERTVNQRRTHGTQLSENLTRILPSENSKEYIIPEESGVYLEIESEQGFSLAIESLDTNFCRLCNVHDYEDGSQSVTVFVPNDKRTPFLSRLEKYLLQSNARSSNRLFDNIANIRLVDLQDFWTSRAESYPEKDSVVWWEVWLSRKSTNRREVEEFQEFCRSRSLVTSTANIQFELYTVIAVKAKESDLAESITLVSCLSELRKIADTSSFILQQSPYDQAEWMKDIISRTEFDIDQNVSVLVLDHGINYTHPLLQHGIDSSYCFAWNTDWPMYDNHHQHGTMQAGVIFYGDISNHLLSDTTIKIGYDIESCRILSPGSENNKELYGSLTYFAVYEAEDKIGIQNRVISMAVTADHEGVTGQPTSWSSEIDQITFNGNHQRLFVLSAGNIRGNDISTDYENNVNRHSIEDPGQSWNAITVGAYTNKVEVSEHYYRSWSALSEAGDICPTSRTSNSWNWKNEAPVKPDIVEEGGNQLISSSKDSLTNADCVSLVTTADHTGGYVFRDHGETSAACALATRISANIWNIYPDYWAETVRALLVHSAGWTPKMIQYRESASNSGMQPRDSKEFMLRMFGHGVPSTRKALSSQNNYLTMIVQDEISPYKAHSGDLKFNEMHLVKLPWPEEELLELRNTKVRLRITLSYFIEPNPGRRSYSERFRYQSFGLRFKLINSNEDVDSFIQRTNIAEREDGFTGQADNTGWILGDHLRTRGTLHQDTWEGQASELALRNHIAILPVAGWWKQRKNKLFEAKDEMIVPYSLVVSLEVDDDIDIYSSVAQQVGIVNPVEIELPSGEI